MFQLVEDGIVVMATGRGITDTKIYDRQAVIDRYGIPPELIPDFYGLKGDTSDNIPGVPGIGDKTAATLLQEFGDLDTVLASVDKISGAKRKENLTNHADDARVSRELARAQRDVPIELDLDESIAREPDRTRLRETFREFELRDPLRRLEEVFESDEEAAPRIEPSSTRKVRARTAVPAALTEAGDDHPALVAERPAPPEDQLPGFGDDGPLRFAAYGGGGEVLEGEAETLGDVTAGWGERPLITHDWKAIAVAEDPCPAPPLAHDTLVAGYLIDPARRGYPLEELADDLGIGADVDGGGPLAERAVLVHVVAERQREALAELGLEKLLEEIELPLVDVLVEMERAGIQLDVAQVRKIGEPGGGGGGRARARDLGARRRGVHDRVATAARRDPVRASRAVEEAARQDRASRPTRACSRRSAPSTRSFAKIEQWRELTKLKSTYLDAFPDLLGQDGRLRTTFSQVTAATGRLSSNNPNLQNIPIRTELGREIRACFVASDGHQLISADYSQVELRLLAHIAGDDVLKEIFRRGEDVHTATAEQILGGAPDPGTRSKAKMVNYGIVYGLSAYGLADRLQIPQDEAQEFIDAYLERFPAVKKFIDDTIVQATEEGFVATLFGRIRRMPEIRARNRQTRQLGERLAVNMVIQGTAADIIKVAMLRCRDALRDAGLETRIVLQIHDELLFEAPEAEIAQASEIVEREMATAFEMDPPLEVDVGGGAELDGGEVVDRWVPVLATVAAGGLVAMQAPINSTLGKAVGTFAAASVSFAVGLVVLASITVLFGGGFGDVGNIADLRWYYLTGGLLGAAYVTTVLVSVRTLGAGGVTAATIAGQLALSVALDRAGVLGLEEKALTPARVAGLVLLAAGVFLVVKD